MAFTSASLFKNSDVKEGAEEEEEEDVGAAAADVVFVFVFATRSCSVSCSSPRAVLFEVSLLSFIAVVVVDAAVVAASGWFCKLMLILDGVIPK